MRVKQTVRATVVAFVALFAVTLAACGSDDGGSGAASTPEGSTSATVRFAAGPVFDAQLPFAAQELGYWDEVGIDAEIRTATELAQGTQAMAAGSLEFAFQSLDVTIPQAATLDSVGWARVDDLWYGLSMVGREGDYKTYEDFVAEGMDETEAVKATLEQLRGKTLVTFFRQWKSSLNGLLAAFDLGTADEFFNIVDMPFQEGAVAFLRGEGDIYMGDLPGTFRVLEDGGVQLTSARQWPPFPGSYLYVGWVAQKEWLEANEDTFMRVTGVLFRVADDLSPRTLEPNERQDAALTAMYEKVNEESGATFDIESARWVNKDVSPWLTVDEMGATLFTPKSPQNWDNMVQDLMESSDGQVDAAAVESQVGQLQPLYEKYLGYRDAAKDDIAKAAGSGSQEVQDLVDEAQHQYDIFNYLDAASLAAEAVEKMGQDG